MSSSLTACAVAHALATTLAGEIGQDGNGSLRFEDIVPALPELITTLGINVPHYDENDASNATQQLATALAAGITEGEHEAVCPKQVIPVLADLLALVSHDQLQKCAQKLFWNTGWMKERGLPGVEIGEVIERHCRKHQLDTSDRPRVLTFVWRHPASHPTEIDIQGASVTLLHALARQCDREAYDNAVAGVAAELGDAYQTPPSSPGGATIGVHLRALADDIWRDNHPHEEAA